MSRAIRVAAPVVIGVWLGGFTSASLVGFSNEGAQFRWTPTGSLPAQTIRGAGFDITTPPTQSGAATGLTMLYVHSQPVTSSRVEATRIERETLNTRIGGGTHYGWVRSQSNSAPTSGNRRYEPIAWVYETEARVGRRR